MTAAQAVEGVREVGALSTAYDEQVRGHVPPYPPVGTVLAQDGPVLRVHHDTHATVRQAPLPRTTAPSEVAALIRRQQEACAERNEPVQWRTYGHDEVSPDAALLMAGFRPGPERSLLIAGLSSLRAERKPPRRHRVRGLNHGDHRTREVAAMAASGGPYRKAYAELRADHGGLYHRTHVQLLESEARLIGVGWAEHLEGTGILAIQGMTGPHPEFLPQWGRWATGSLPSKDITHVVAETADDRLKAALIEAGFEEVSSVRTYRWGPPGSTPATTRPVRVLLDEPEYDGLLHAFKERFSFRPSVSYYPGIEEPEASVTWHVGDISDTAGRLLTALPDDHPVRLVQAIAERGLRACARPGEPLYSADWNHQGYVFDPTRVGGPGRPGWPGVVCREGDYHKYLTADLRLGTFWHPWEESLCVFGADLLTEVEADLTAALGTVMRRGGRNTGNVWTFESVSGRPTFTDS
ncbi:DUF2716 domain-containing protein [Streptomyces sp. NPDC056464]|uniref:DUF2716 domain-containing protein n=1 Tax=Streptomyces sp. NPDC056464 TaxID=3345828 RepID=UPI00368243B3